MKLKSNQNNKGFTLIELLISISILAIVLLPLLNNFVTAAKVNAKSKRMQNETVLTQNLLEEVKALKVVDLAARYNYPADFPEFNSEVAELVLKNGNFEAVTDTEKSIIKNTVNGETEYTLIDKRNQPYYFTKKNISVGGRKYDALITLDGTAYMAGETSAETDFNSYQMPVFSDLDTVNNLLVLQSYEDRTAADALFFKYLTINQGLEDAMTADQLKDLKDQIQSRLKKEIKVSITGVRPYSTDVNFIYTVDGFPDAGSVVYSLGAKNLDIPKGSIYIFYFPSSENTLTIQMDSLISDSVDIYAICQRSNSQTGGELTITNTIPVKANLYSNSNQIPRGNDLVKKAQPQNRIYKVQVQLYTAGTHYSSDSLCAEFTSTKED